MSLVLDGSVDVATIKEGKSGGLFMRLEFRGVAPHPFTESGVPPSLWLKQDVTLRQISGCKLFAHILYTVHTLKSRSAFCIS